MKKLTKVSLCSAMALSVLTPVPLSANDSKVGEADINLALNKNGVTSSVQDSNTPASEAFDGIHGDNGNRWASVAGVDGSGVDESWIYVDLGSVQKVSRFVLDWESRPNKFKMQVSSDLDTWTDVTDVIDNGFLEDPNAAFPANKAKNDIVLDEPVEARYVKMQGVQRRRRLDSNGGASNRTGYSLYEFEVYGPGWGDDEFVNEYMNQIVVPDSVRKNFKLEVENADYGVNVAWTSNSDAIVIDANGQAIVNRTEEDQIVTLTATITRGEVTKEKTFEVIVRSSTGTEYEIYPIPQNLLYDEGELELSDEVNLVFEDTVSDTTKENYTDVFKKLDIQYTESSSVDSEKTNVIVGIKDGTGIADEYFENVEYRAEESTDKNEGYVFDIDDEKNTIAVLGNNDKGTKYGSYTLEDILEQGGNIVRDLTIEDAPDIEFRGFIEGFYGAWSHENRKSLIDFGGEYKMNTYIYGPKNDPYHYGQWRDLYPADKLAELKELVDAGKKSGVEFVWAAHVGGHTDLSDTDIEALKVKFDQLYEIGVRQFAIFFDDAWTDNTRLIEYMNKIQHEYVDVKGDVKPLIFCPQYYNKKNGNETYLKNLRNFDKRIQIMWTGDFVVSEINQSVIDYIVNLIERPVYIWWNWPVNDLGRSHLMHLGPSEALQNNIQNMSGLTSNPMNQAQASKVGLYSIADYTWNTGDYDSNTSWRSALTHIIEDDEEASHAFEIFAQNCAAAPMSFSYTDESVYMKKDLAALKEKFLNKEDYSEEAETVKAHFVELKEAITTLKAYKGTNNLVGEINPWLDVVYDIADAGYYVVDHLDEYDLLDKEDGESIENAKAIIREGKAKLNKSNNGHGGKKAAQKVLYPFVEDLLADMEERMYHELDVRRSYQGFGSAKKDYKNAFDGSKSTTVGIGQYIEGDYFGVNLGKEMNVTDIELVMQEKEGNKYAYYKSGVLEYSLDNKTWTELGNFSGTDVKCNTNIKARYIRYRATEEHENIATGENLSNVILKEIYINEQKIAATTTNDETLTGLTTTKDENIITVAHENGITLQPGKAIRTTFDRTKNLTFIALENEEAVVKVSEDGREWTNVSVNELRNMTARYVEVSNPSDHAISFDHLEIRLAGKLALKASLTTNSGDVYSGNANNLVDGNEGSTLWLKRGDNGNPELTRYIDLDLQGVAALNDMEVVFSGDNVLYGKVDVSMDKENWETIYSFDKVGKEKQVIKFNGEKARYVRYWMSNGNWLQIKEIYINKNLDQNVSNFEEEQKAYNDMIDGDLFTEYKPGSAAGSFVYNTTGNENPKELFLLKDNTSTVSLEAKVKNASEDGLIEEWVSLGAVKDARNIIDLSSYDVTAIRVSWQENANPEISEFYFRDQKDLNKDALNEVIAEAQRLIEEGVLDHIDVDLAQLLTTTLIDAINVRESMNMTQSDIDYAEIQLNDVLSQLTADYRAVDEAIASVPADLSVYTKESQKALQDALNAVVRDLELSRQEEVNEMAEAIIVAIANLEKEIYTVTVNGDIAVTGKYNEKVKVTAPVVEGKEFTGWLFNGKVVSTSETYTFFISEDMELTPCYEEVTVTAEALLTNTILTKRDTKADVKFVGQLIVPEGYTIKNAGLVWSSKEDTVLDLEHAKPTYITRISNTNQFSVTIKGMPEGRFMRGRIFATFVDDEGKEVVVYSEEERVVNK